MITPTTRFPFLPLAIAAGLIASPAHAEVRLPKIFGSQMILQQDKSFQP